MYIKTRVFSFKFVNKYYSTLDPLQRTGTLLVVLQQAIPPGRGGQTCSSGFGTVEAVVITSLFVFSKRQRAKRNPNVAVANLGAHI